MKKDIGVRVLSQQEWDIVRKKYNILHSSQWTNYREHSIIFFELQSYGSKSYAEESPSKYELISFQEWEERFNDKWVPKVGDWVVITQDGYTDFGTGQLLSEYDTNGYFNVTNSVGRLIQFKNNQFRKALPHEIPNTEKPKVGEYYFFGKELYVINDIINNRTIRISGVGGGSASVKNKSYNLDVFYGGTNADSRWRKALPHEIPSNTKPLSAQGGEAMVYGSSVTMVVGKNRHTSISAHVVVDYKRNSIEVPITPKKQKRILEINTKY